MKAYFSLGLECRLLHSRFGRESLIDEAGEGEGEELKRERQRSVCGTTRERWEFNVYRRRN